MDGTNDNHLFAVGLPHYMGNMSGDLSDDFPTHLSFELFPRGGLLPKGDDQISNANGFVTLSMSRKLGVWM